MIEADFHIHSKYSKDSLLCPNLIIRTARRMGLSAIAVTDHGTIKGALETVQKASNLNRFFVIPGIEVKTSIGDVIGLFVEDEIASKNFFEVVDEIKEQNGLIVLPHQSRGHKNISDEFMFNVDVVEALNGRSSRVENFKSRKLSFSLNKPVIAGSDAHFSFEIGRVRTVFLDSPTSLENLKKSIICSERKLIGRESPFIVHVFSFGVEIIKRITG